MKWKYQQKTLDMTLNIVKGQIKYLSILFSLIVVAPNTFAVDKACSSGESNIPRAMFSTGIENREPVDRVLILDNSRSDVYFFSDLRHLQGRTIKHRWEFEGKLIKEKSFEVKGPRWRVYSLHKLDKEMLGRWTVVVADDNGCPLRAVIFKYVAKEDGGQTAAIIKLQ